MRLDFYPLILIIFSAENPLPLNQYSFAKLISYILRMDESEFLLLTLN